MPIRFNDVDLVAFLKCKGVSHSFVEFENGKVYFHYDLNVDCLVEEFEKGITELNIKEYSKTRKGIIHISKVITQQKNPKK